MGYASQILHMIIFMIFRLTSLNAALHFSDNHHVQRVSGEEKNEGLVFEKFRALLGLQSFNMKKKLFYSHDFRSGSPSHSPIEAPAPAPMLYHHVHSHHHSHRPRITAPRRRRIKKEKSNQGLVTRNVVLFIVSASVMFVLLGILLIWGCKKFRKRRKETSTMAITHSSDVENNSRAKAVGIIQKVNREMVQSESQSVSSAAGDTVSGNKIEKSSVGCSSQIKDKKTSREVHSDNNKSFQSLYYKHSSNARFSYASAVTLSETSGTAYPNKSNLTMASSFLPPVQPPPPPPPPPLKRIHMFPSTSRSLTTMTPTALSSAFSDLTSTSNGDHYSESNQNLQGNLKGQSKIPQPFPPPFPKGPPPPPSPLQTYRSLDKDGNQLPKLKPLHWDKVRTAPDHSMVWDKIRSSSFE